MHLFRGTEPVLISFNQVKCCSNTTVIVRYYCAELAFGCGGTRELNSLRTACTAAQPSPDRTAHTFL